MALLTPPTAQEIYDEAGHGNMQGVTPELFGYDTDAEVLDVISSQILPAIVARVNNEADESAYPFDYPLASDVWKQARPTFTDAQINEEIANQEAPFTIGMRKLAASDLLGRVVTTNDFWIKRAEILKEAGEALLASAKTGVGNVVKRTLDAQAQGRAGFGLLSIDTEPKPFGSEFGLSYSAPYGEF